MDIVYISFFLGLSMKVFNAEATFDWSNLSPVPLTRILPLGNLSKPRYDIWSLIPGNHLCLQLLVPLGLHFSQVISGIGNPVLESLGLMDCSESPLEPLGKCISLRNVILKIPMENESILDLRVADHECKKLSNSKECSNCNQRSRRLHSFPLVMSISFTWFSSPHPPKKLLLVISWVSQYLLFMKSYKQFYNIFGRHIYIWI